MSLYLNCERCGQWSEGGQGMYGWRVLCDECRRELVAIDEQRKEQDIKDTGRVVEHARGHG